jgi:MFS family permease
VTQGLLIAGSPDEFRGRVMGLYTMMTAGGVPIAALIGGAIGSIAGPGEAVGIAAVVMFAFLAWVLITRKLRVVRLDLPAEPVDDPALVPTVEIDPAL